MKVKELLELLATVNPESEVILQKDAEGNGYSPLYAIDDEAIYIPDSTYSGKVYSIKSKYTAEDQCMTEEQWTATKAKPRCLVIAPIN